MSPDLHRPRAAQSLAEQVQQVRRASLDLIEGLSAEDLAAQSMPDASPGKWHLGHTSWFFEALVLGPHADAAPLRPGWEFLLNSYYESLGARHPRPERGLLTRPSLEDVLRYREEVDAALATFLGSGQVSREAWALVELGLHHEQQHQELFVTDVKHLLAQNELVWQGVLPAWRSPAAGGRFGQPGMDEHAAPPRRNEAPPPPRWIEFEGAGPVEIGAPSEGFCFDNERPRHTTWLRPFAIADRPVTCGEYLRFIEAGGYQQPRFWLSDGFAQQKLLGWEAPLYWRKHGSGWLCQGVCGAAEPDWAAPVSHLSYYEAEAYARFAGMRLPTETEWEVACTTAGWQAQAGTAPREPTQSVGHGGIGEVWEWTASPYVAYPGFRPLDGAAAEYNGKFMSGQMVLRGGSCATPREHLRPTYRNFFPPSARWQFSGLRLARDLQ